MKYLIIFVLIISNLAMASTTKCNESVTIQLAKYLNNKDPDAKLVLVLNQDNQVVGLTDISGLNPDINLYSVKELSSNIQLNTYGHDDISYLVKYELNPANNISKCKVISILEVLAD